MCGQSAHEMTDDAHHILNCKKLVEFAKAVCIDVAGAGCASWRIFNHQLRYLIARWNKVVCDYKHADLNISSRE
jgi:hypothetical protein